MAIGGDCSSERECKDCAVSVSMTLVDTIVSCSLRVYKKQHKANFNDSIFLMQ